MVYLIGAGPGHIGYISVLGATLIKQADCIIYDRLLNPELLKDIKKDCECIYVGKENKHHTLKQEEINSLLIEKSKEHKIVVRLKGGDCFVFGRGGEEGIALYNAHIPFEVIPGIPSFIGGLSSVGIPITHRGIATGIHILTAHGKNNEPLEIDFSSIKDNETTVFMMGLSKLEEIVSNLLQYKDKNFPIAIVYNGSNKNQRVLVSTLENILSEFKKDPFPSPCLIVAGNVLQFQKQLDYTSRKKSVAFPRVSKDASILSNSLSYLGYDIHEYHVSELKMIENAIDSIDLSQHTHIVFSSKFGVQCFFRNLRKNRTDLRSLNHLKFCVIGASTGNECIKYGIYPDICPDYYTSEELCKLMNNTINGNANILICTVEGNEQKWDYLNPSFNKTFVYLYENIQIPDSIHECDEDAIVFTCSSAVNRTLSQIQLSNQMLIFSIGPKTTETLIEHGYTNIIQSKQADYNSLIECIEEHL